MGPRSCSRGAFDVQIEGFALFGGDFVKGFISVSTAVLQLSHVRFMAPHPVSTDTMQVSKWHAEKSTALERLCPGVEELLPCLQASRDGSL
jgi:hypothetical protein